MKKHPGLLGRLVAKDSRDARFPLSALIRKAPERPAPSYRYWTGGPILDQGQTSSCVGHGWRAFLNVSPIREKGGPDAMAIYHGAQQNDEFPGENYDGTSVRGGAKFLQGLGYLDSYHWATSMQDIEDFVLRLGSVVIGINWYTSMFDPDKSGLVKISGNVEGGHCVLVMGHNKNYGLYEFQNSWGKSWGHAGRGYLRSDDLQRLIFQENGEACAAIEKKFVPAQ